MTEQSGFLALSRLGLVLQKRRALRHDEFS